MNAGRAVTLSLPARVTAPAGTSTRKPLRSRKVAPFCGSTWTLAVDRGGAALCCAAVLHAACISRSTTIKTATSGSRGRRATAFTAPDALCCGFCLAMNSPAGGDCATAWHISEQQLHWPRPNPHITLNVSVSLLFTFASPKDSACLHGSGQRLCNAADAPRVPANPVSLGFDQSSQRLRSMTGRWSERYLARPGARITVCPECHRGAKRII